MHQLEGCVFVLSIASGFQLAILRGSNSPWEAVTTLGSHLRPDPPSLRVRFRVRVAQALPVARIATEPSDSDDGGLRLEEPGVAAADLNGVRIHYPSGVLVVLMELRVRVPAWEFRLGASPEPY